MADWTDRETGTVEQRLHKAYLLKFILGYYTLFEVIF